MPGGDPDVAQVHARMQHGRDESMPEHVRVRPGNRHASGPGKPPQASSGSVAVHRDAMAGLEPADRLHPPDVQLQMRPTRSQRVQVASCVPDQIAAQVGLGVLTGAAPEPG